MVERLSWALEELWISSWALLLCFFSFCLECQHQCKVPEVAAAILPASHAQWKKKCITCWTKLLLPRHSGIVRAPFRSPTTEMEIKAWLLACCSACPRYEMQPQHFKRPFQKEVTDVCREVRGAKVLTSRSFLFPRRCDWWQRKVHLHHARGDGCRGSVYQGEGTSLHRRAGPSKQFPDQPPAWQPSCCSNYGMKLWHEKIQREFNLLVNKPHK